MSLFTHAWLVQMTATYTLYMRRLARTVQLPANEVHLAVVAENIAPFKITAKSAFYLHCLLNAKEGFVRCALRFLSVSQALATHTNSCDVKQKNFRIKNYLVILVG